MWGYTGNDPDVGRFSTEISYPGNRSLNPGNERLIFMYRIPLYRSYSYRIRFLKQGSRQFETRVGGDFSFTGWPGSYTYRLQGRTITGSDFEAYFNYLASRFGDNSTGPTNLGK